MGHIGKLIKAVRESKGYSRAKLADGICSSKYIYLIENEMRTPSSEVLIAIGNTLNFDLHEYFPYMDCEDPIAVKSFIEEFRYLRETKDLDRLDERIEDAGKYIDFKKAPWKSELDFNQAFSKLFRGAVSENTLAMIRKGIHEAGGSMEIERQEGQIVSIELLSFYNLLSIYYYMSQNNREGFRYLSYAYQTLYRRKEIKRYRELFIPVASNYLNALYLEKEYQRTIDTAEDLLDFMKRINSLERSFLAHFMVALVNNTLGNREIALKALKKALAFGQLFEKTDDLKHLMEYEFVQDFHRSNELGFDLAEAV